MEPVGTIAELLEIAITAERNSERLYDSMSQMFIRFPEVALFWEHYANEEAGHARWMEHLRERMTPGHQAEPADGEVWRKALSLANTPVDDLLASIRTLQDAWELANELEHGETNLIFEFLIDNFSNDANTMIFLRTQLREHMDHLTSHVPPQLSNATLRSAIMAESYIE
jgi:hypothetical protein